MFSPFARPLYVMTKAVGSACDLACSYCYYREKAPAGRMDPATLREFISQYLDAQTQPEVQFVWHGGEPTLVPLSFYREAVRLQKELGRGRIIENCLQTNGLGLTDEWCRFLAEEHWLTGLSIDGTAEMHDRYRRDHEGNPTHSRVIRAAEMLDRHGAEWNAMATVNAANQWQGREFYEFFRSIGCRWLQFSPVAERRDVRGRLASPDEPASLTPESVTPEGWGQFLCDVFDCWRQGDIGEVYVQIFEATLANWLGRPPGLCTLSPTCGHALALEADGSLYSCDHFVFPAYRLGNIRQTPLLTMAHSEAQRRFGRRKLKVYDGCLRCEYHFACFGECPRLRFAPGGRNYLCEGYRRFFAHAAPAFDRMAALIRSDQPLPSSL